MAATSFWATTIDITRKRTDADLPKTAEFSINVNQIQIPSQLWRCLEHYVTKGNDLEKYFITYFTTPPDDYKTRWKHLRLLKSLLISSNVVPSNDTCNIFV